MKSSSVILLYLYSTVSNGDADSDVNRYIFTISEFKKYFKAAEQPKEATVGFGFGVLYSVEDQ